MARHRVIGAITIRFLKAIEPNFVAVNNLYFFIFLKYLMDCYTENNGTYLLNMDSKTILACYSIISAVTYSLQGHKGQPIPTLNIIDSTIRVA